MIRSSRSLMSDTRRGYTLIETLATLSIISVAISLLIPAVHSAREAARRMQCQNNLHQIGLAVHQYHDANGMYPPAISHRSELWYGGFYSVHSRILPYMDQLPLYDSINFMTGTWSTDSFDFHPYGELRKLNIYNATPRHTHIALFLCPSDGGRLAKTGNNYRGNVGVGPNSGTTAEHPDSGNGIFPEMEYVRMSYVTDGLGHTVAFSERLRGSASSTRISPERDAFQDPLFILTADDLLKSCTLAARPGNRGFVLNGKWWFWTGREYTLYNHAQPPNGPIPDCTGGNSASLTGMFTARSWHNGGVNALMADGSIRFVSESIALDVWRGLGTRNGRELVD